MPIINSRSDLDSLIGSPAYADALRAILGATTTWVNVGTADAPSWEQQSVLSHVEALGFADLNEFLAECAAAGITPVTPEPPITPPPPAPTAEDVIAERARRLALGFDYDFGDGRGVHHIGTTDADMKGWDEVAKASSAFIALGAPTTEIAIVTDTGPVTVTALEFQAILAAATAARQPIWAASFALQAMDPIPVDYADNSYWVSP